jgi:hypothetical protein
MIRCKEAARRFKPFGACKNSQRSVDHCCSTCYIYLYALRSEDKKIIDSRLIPKVIPAKINNWKTLLHSTTTPDAVVIDRFNVQLTQSKLWCLKEGEWLNDEVINFVIMMIRERWGIDNFTTTLLS